MRRFLLQIGFGLLSALFVLPIYGSAQTTTGPLALNPFNVQATDLERTWANRTPPEKAVILDRIYGLREYVDNAAELTRFFASVAQTADENRLVRDAAAYYQSRMDLHAGRLDDAAEKLAALGLLANWTIAGPFHESSGADTRFGPEQGLSSIRSYDDGAGHQRTWRAASPVGPLGWVDLANYFAADSQMVFATTSVFASEVHPVALRFGADSPLSVYVNGRQVFASAGEAQFAFDQYSAGAVLESGWNSITVKLHRDHTGPWRFSVRITGIQGGGLQLAASAVQSTTAHNSTNSPTVADLKTDAQQSAADDSGSADVWEILGSLEWTRGLAGALDHLQRAAHLDGSADRWLKVAAACSDAPCKLSALNAAVAAEPESAAAQAELADYYSGRGQLFKARGLLQRAVAAAPDNFVYAKKLGDLYVASGASSAAMAEYRRLESHFPAPLWLRRELAARYEELGLVDRALALAERTVVSDFDGERLHAALLRIYQRRGDAAKIRAVLEQARRLDASDARAVAQLADLDAGSGNYSRAEQELRAALATAPNDAALHRSLADILEASGRNKEAVGELARSLELAPDDGARLQMAVLSGSGAGDADHRYCANAADLAAQVHRQPPHDAANAVELADIRVERLSANGLATTRAQQIVYIATDQAVRDYAVRSIQYANGAQHLQVIAARVFKSDGRVIEAEDAGETNVADTAASMYYDARTRSLRFPTLQRGDVVELDYRLSPDSAANPYGDYFGELVTFGSALPRRLQRYVLITPAGANLNVLESRVAQPAQVRVDGNERVYSWEARNLDPLPSEPRGPALTEVAPYVHVSTFSSWQQLGRWYARLIEPQFVLDTSLREVSSGIVAGAHTDQEKIAAIHQFVLRNTHYVALEFGIYGYKPYSVAQVYARRFGDCKDKASLMIALLRAAGIDAEIALVRTRRLGDVGERATSIAIFNHAVVYIPRYGLWLDGTAEYAGSRELPLDDQGAMALTVARNGDAHLRRIPVTLPMENYTHRQVLARVRGDGHIEFTGSAYTRGEDAPGLRRDFEVRERQRDSFRNRLAEVLPSVRLEQVQVEGANDLERDVVVNFSGELDTFAGRRSLLLSPSWMRRSYVQTLAPLASRTEDLLLPAPWTTEEELHFRLPAGARLEAVPQEKILDTPFGAAVLRYQRRGDEFVVTTSVQFRKLRITPAEYGSFRDFCAQVDNAFRNEIKVVL